MGVFAGTFSVLGGFLIVLLFWDGLKLLTGVFFADLMVLLSSSWASF